MDFLKSSHGFTRLYAHIVEEDDAFTVRVRMLNHLKQEQSCWGEEIAPTFDMASSMIESLASQFSIPQNCISIKIMMRADSKAAHCTRGRRLTGKTALAGNRNHWAAKQLPVRRDHHGGIHGPQQSTLREAPMACRGGADDRRGERAGLASPAEEVIHSTSIAGLQDWPTAIATVPKPRPLPRSGRRQKPVPRRARYRQKYRTMTLPV
jgi:hypothetical protein